MAKRSKWAAGAAVLGVLLVLTPAGILAADAAVTTAERTRNASGSFSDVSPPPAETGETLAETLFATVPLLAWVGAVAVLLGILTLGGTVALRRTSAPGARRRS